VTVSALQAINTAWKKYRLGEILTLINGRAYCKSEERTEGTPVLRIQNLNGGDRWFYSDLNLPANKYCDNGDLLFAWSATFGPYIWWGGKVIYHYHIWKIECGPLLDKKFAFYLLQHITQRVKSAGRGISMLHMTKSGMEDWEVEIPPLQEQRRIAGILDQADALRHLRRRSLSRLADLGQAIFFEMFGDVAENPKGWPVGTIRDLLSEAKYGTAQKANTDGKGLPILRMGNLTYSGQLDLTDLKHVELSAKDFPKYTTQRGDLLFNRTNSKDLVGKTAVVDLDDPLAIAGYLIRARINKRGNPYYISAYLNSRHGKAVLRNMCKNIVGMANINAQELQDIAIALPPVELQNEFADRLAVITKRREDFNSGIEQADFLFAALQHRAFRGEL